MIITHDRELLGAVILLHVDHAESLTDFTHHVITNDGAVTTAGGTETLHVAERVFGSASIVMAVQLSA